MSEHLHTDDGSKHSEEHETPYADAHGEPLTCPDCGEYVAVHYHPQGEFAANYAGFVAHCACTAGPKLHPESVENIAPRLIVDVVLETEEDGEDWLEYYLHDHWDVSSWTGDGDE